MSAPPKMRRTDKIMSDEETLETLQRGFCGRVATIGEDGFPYCIPMIYVWQDSAIWLHNASAKGHLRSNVDHASKVCFEVDEPGQEFS